MPHNSVDPVVLASSIVFKLRPSFRVKPAPAVRRAYRGRSERRQYREHHPGPGPAR